MAFVLIAVLASAFAVYRPDRIMRVASGLAAHSACSAAFVSRLPPQIQTAETLGALVGAPSRLLRYRVNAAEGRATASFLGMASRSAQFTPGYGCRLEYPLNDLLGPAKTASPAATAALPSALDHGLDPVVNAVFGEKADSPIKAVKAVLVMRDGQIVAERYAAGIGPVTPLPSWSVAKSLTNLMVGILVYEGRLRINQRVGAPEWRGQHDLRQAITIEQLLRMEGGLDAKENEAPTDPVARMEFLQRDMAAFAAHRRLKVPPGREWEYTSANTLILDRLIGDTVGGGAAGLRSFVAREIERPLGLSTLTLEFDGAGTFVGSSFAYASTRDYARLGQLFLSDGVTTDGRRLLPEGWMAWSRRSTLGTGYGAGFWTNDGAGPSARRRIAAGFPADGFYASGTLGQRIYIVPSARLVVVRLGNSMPPDFGLDDDLRLIDSAIRACPAYGLPASGPRDGTEPVFDARRRQVYSSVAAIAGRSRHVARLNCRPAAAN